MKTIRRLTFLSLGALTAAYGQTTKFSGRTIGMPVDQWIIESGIDQAAVCGPHKRNDRKTDWKSACNKLIAARAGASTVIDEKEPPAQWFFDGGKVSHVIVIKGLLGSSADEQIKFLTEVYGPPVKRGTVTNRNLVGGSWDTAEAYWDMPDGASMACIETLDIGLSGPQRTLYIEVDSKEAKDKPFGSKPVQGNPYK